MSLVLGQTIYGFEGTKALVLFMIGGGGIVALSLLFIRLPVRVWLLAGMLFAASLTPQANEERTAFIATWMLPIQIIRTQIHFGLGIALTVVLLCMGRANNGRLPIQGTIIMFILFFAGLMTFVHDTPMHAIETVVFVLCTVPCALLTASHFSQTYEDSLVLIRAMLLVSVVWAGACVVQFVIQPAFLVAGGRFLGMHANPQAAAIMLAPWTVMTIFMLLNDPVRRLRIIWMGLLGINLLFMGWTGSRTGMLMFVVGSGLLLHKRMKTVIYLLPIAIVLVFALANLADALHIGSSLDRLVSTANTRGGTIVQQIEAIKESPLVGVGVNEVGASENSYLLLWASYGIGEFILGLVLVVVSAGLCLKLWSIRPYVDDREQSLVDMIICFNGLYFVGAMFEGYILGRSSGLEIMMYIFSPMASALILRGMEARQIAFEPQTNDQYECDYEAA